MYAFFLKKYSRFFANFTPPYNEYDFKFDFKSPSTLAVEVLAEH